MKKLALVGALLVCLLAMSGCTSFNDVDYVDKTINVFEEIPSDEVAQMSYEVSSVPTNTFISYLMLDGVLEIDEDTIIVYQYRL